MSIFLYEKPQDDAFWMAARNEIKEQDRKRAIKVNFPQLSAGAIDKAIAKLSYKDKSVWPFLLIAALSSLCQASLLQSIGFFVTDVFSNEKDLPLVISLTFVVLSISTVVSQYIFTDLKPISNNKLLIYGTFLITVSYILAALSHVWPEQLDSAWPRGMRPEDYVTSAASSTGPSTPFTRASAH